MITIIAEKSGNTLHPVTSQLVNAAISIGSNAHVICPGGIGADEATKITGVQKVTSVLGDCFKIFDGSAWAEAINSSIDEDSNIIFTPATSQGREIGAIIAAKRKVPIIQDAISLDSTIQVTRTIYSGKALEKIQSSSKCVITIRPNSFDSAPQGNNAPLNTVDKSANLRIAIKEAIVKASERLDVSEADIIISGGRGMGSIDNFAELESLADMLGAAVGASRAVVDEWGMSHAMQVGQTGKTVTPSLYIAVGISGAIQHLAGMRSSNYIVAINKDQDAPIFNVADYGIVASWEDALPVLKEELSKL